MKGTAAALRRLAPEVRLVLLHGPDVAASADHARALAHTRPDPATVIAAAGLTGDPAALVAAASEIAMFGGPHWVRVDDAGEDVLAAVGQVLDAAVTEHPVAVVAGALKKGSKLLARVEGAANALAVVSYPPDAAATGSMVAEVAAEFGLRPTREAVAALVQATGGDRGLVRQEVAKLALYVDATPAAPLAAEAADVAAVGADFADADLGALVDGVAGGSPVVVGRQLAEHAAVPGITLLRAVGRRFWLLLDLRAAVDAGVGAARAVDAARPPVFWKDKAVVAAQVAKWRTAAIRGALDRLLDAERQVKRSGSAGDVAAHQLLLSLATQAART